jgi:hypothetical protein
MSNGETMSRVRLIGGGIDATGGLNAAGSDESAATGMHMSAQLIPNHFAGQHGHFGACPSWLIDEWQ